MAKVRIDFHYGEFNKLRNDPAVVADLERRAHAVATAAGPGHEVSVRAGAARARASVRTVTDDAKEAEAVDKNLTKSITAGRT